MHPEHPFWQQADFWLTVVTALLVLATVWLVKVTKKMSRESGTAMAELVEQARHAANSSTESSKSARESAEALKIQASVAAANAEATRDALEFARENARRTERFAQANYDFTINAQRGWLIVAAVKYYKRGYTFMFDITFRNVGTSPVSDVNVYRCEALQETEPTSFDEAHHQAVAIVPPQGSFVITSHYSASDEELAGLRGATPSATALFFYGRLEYKDIFHNRRSTSWKYFGLFDEESIAPWTNGNDFN